MDEISAAKRIACYGGGRGGLRLKAVAMQLFVSGLEVHVVGYMTIPALTSGDLLFARAGPGNFSTVDALVATERQA